MALGINFQYLWIKLNICVNIKFIHVDKNKSVTRRNLTLETRRSVFLLLLLLLLLNSLLFASFLLSRLSGLSQATRQQLAGDETGVCHTSIGVRIDTFAECETEVAFGAMY